jgi:hypothetical protein
MLIARKETRTPQNRLRVLDDVTALRHVQTVQELSDILVADLADLLDIGGTLGDVLERLSDVSIAWLSCCAAVLTFPDSSS